MARYEVQSMSKYHLGWDVACDCRKDAIHLSPGERIVLSEKEYSDLYTQKLLSKKAKQLRLIRQLP